MRIERAWRKKGYCIKNHLDFSLVEKALHWLEKEDSSIEKAAVYAICLTVVGYFYARMCQTFM